MSTPDFTFENHGSIWLCRPAGAAQLKHLEDNVGDEAQWWGGGCAGRAAALVVESRYVLALGHALQAAGYEVVS